MSNDDNLTASSKVSAKIDVVDTHYSKSATYFKVTLKDTKGNSISNQKISFKVNGVTYTAITDKNGIATLKISAKVRAEDYNKVMKGMQEYLLEASIKHNIK